MNVVKIFTLLIVGLSLSCGSSGLQSSRSQSESTNKASGVSYGTYAPNGAANAANAVARQDLADVSGEKQAGGGGGGRTLADQTNLAVRASQTISLDQPQASQINTAPTDRKIVRNAELNLEADSPEQAQQKITTIAESKGGFVVESQQSSSDTKVTTRDIVTMTVRVPAEKFTEALDEIRKTSSRVIVETVKGEDVTEEFIDIEARLKAQKALEQQFVEIMKRANSVDDALSVQRQLAEVRGDIEKIEGRKHFLENQASLSTIKIRLQTPAVFSASGTGFFYRLTESFRAGFDFALNFILGLVTFLIASLPFALFIGLPIYLVVRYVIRKQKKDRSVREIIQEEIETN